MAKSRACASAAFLACSSSLTVISSSLVDCSSSLAVSSSSLRLCSSSLAESASSVVFWLSSRDVWCSSIAERNRSFASASCCFSREIWRSRISPSGGASGGSASRPAAPGTGSKRTRTDRFCLESSGTTSTFKPPALPSCSYGTRSCRAGSPVFRDLLDQLLDFQKQSSIGNQLHEIEAHLSNRQREVGTRLAPNLEHLQVLVHHHTGRAVLRQEYAIDLFSHVRAVPQFRSGAGGGGCPPARPGVNRGRRRETGADSSPLPAWHRSCVRGPPPQTGRRTPPPPMRPT